MALPVCAIPSFGEKPGLSRGLSFRVPSPHFVEVRPGDRTFAEVCGPGKEGLRRPPGVSSPRDSGPTDCIPSLCPSSAGRPAQRAGQSCLSPQNTGGAKIPHPRPHHSPGSQDSISLAQYSHRRDVLSSSQQSWPRPVLPLPHPAQQPPPRETAALRRLRCFSRNLCHQKHSSASEASSISSSILGMTRFKFVHLT